MVGLFSLTIGLAAFLLFAVQPMFGKMLLPFLGGAPQVWNTCLLFFQAALLIGYGYAHAASRLPAKIQVPLHLVLVGLSCLLLPVDVTRPLQPPSATNPVLWILGTLTLLIGAPFVLLSATSPLLQRWFSRLGHRDAQDPYFLYAASNTGSLAALLAYPFMIEPRWILAGQSQAWTYGYYGLLVLLLFCGGTVLAKNTTAAGGTARETGATPEGITRKQRALWVGLAFVPASLMYGVTTYLSTDIAPFPLLWIVPLSLYLITFILAFSRRSTGLLPFTRWFFPIALIPLAVVLAIGSKVPLWFAVTWQLVSFFVMALYCHGELAARRPAAVHLTEFYWWLSVGGVLGGIFNAILAPVLLKTTIEYQIAIILACVIRMGALHDLRYLAQRWLYAILPLCCGLLLFIVSAVAFYEKKPGQYLGEFIFYAAWLGFAFLVYRFRKLRLLLGIGGLLYCSTLPFRQPGFVLTARSYFGVHRIQDIPRDQLRKYMHGTTLHGIQSLDPAERRNASAYYHITGPAGDIFEAFHKNLNSHRAGLIGLGVGSLAALGTPEDRLTFYEIDPMVQKIASDPRYFTFLADSPATLTIVLGDGRLSMAREPAGHFALILVDAFSSDSVPAHLITREAIRLYRQKLAADGLLAFHISNRYLNLESVLAKVAADGDLVCLVRKNVVIPEDPLLSQSGKLTSHWVVMGPAGGAIEQFRTKPGWRTAEIRHPEEAPWTDHFYNLLSALR